MDNDNLLEQINVAIQGWNRDGAPFNAVQKVAASLNEANQTFSSITVEMTAKGAEVNTLCESTQKVCAENSQKFQKWFDPAAKDCNHLRAALGDLEKRETPPDDKFPEKLYKEFDNSRITENSVDKDEISAWIERTRRNHSAVKHSV